MLTKATRRWLAGFGVAGALVAASATPAAAEESAVQLGLYMNDTTVAVGTDGKVESPTLYASEPVIVHDLTVRYDYTDLAGKVKLTPEIDGECTTPEQNVLVCQDPFEIGLEEWGYGGLFNVAIAPTDSAKDGDSGSLKVTVSADGFEPASHTATVKIGEGVDLAGGPEVDRSAAPGGEFTAPLVLSNVGEGTSAKGAVVIFDHDYAIRPGKHYSNCTYAGDQLRTCRFTDTVAPGETFSATVPYVLGKDTYAPGNAWGSHMWLTPDEFDDFTAYLKSRGISVGEPGTDEALVLTKQPTMTAQSFQADVNPENNWSGLQVKVTGNNGVDLAAIGDSVDGKAGDVVTATVGVRNNGPAVLDLGRVGSPVTKIDVTVPTGTTAVNVPDNCFPMKGDDVDWEPGKPGAKAYRCYPEIFIAVGEEQTVDLGLRIDKVVPNATGTVTINAKCECEGFQDDTNPANDTAKLVVNAAPGTGGNGDGGNGGGAGGGGTLPITGSATGLIAGVGVLLLTAGVGGYVVARRRRTRFVA
ncbi:LPXTG cell wall anchor domain-containing protein [Micromonospora globispora]|uniref:LPXTG cell wall anchor domain-containing protein n=1 Tax=Micromonospora globispora TaxID=1450148 RepID=A0A317KFL0_9ACTN|nr:LPXTG cell wall anchor domain-containing protein [Micromonospora globispora]PWU50424.1 LPXTG cell wall anchor domain-containing protein [Micromonospora globispora]PWU60018.1 LPXTG cell wall anchor domain-containing protein [Micromonospora globispora]RQW97000.1 LPXTG cell wall anchor domain-containing protein [Micromonospora globispora]